MSPSTHYRSFWRCVCFKLSGTPLGNLGTKVLMVIGLVRGRLLCPYPPIGWRHQALMAVVFLSIHLSLLYMTLSREQKPIASWNWQEGSPWHGWPVTPFRGRKVISQGNEVRSKNIVIFEMRLTSAGVWSDSSNCRWQLSETAVSFVRN